MDQYPKPLRTEKYRQIAECVEDLGHQQATLCKDHVDQAVAEVVQGTILREGTQGAAELADLVGDRSNLGQSAFLTLLTASKGASERMQKLGDLLTFFERFPEERVKWFMWERSTFAEYYLAIQWKTKRTWTRNTLLGFRQHFGNHIHREPWVDLHLTKKEVLRGINAVKTQMVKQTPPEKWSKKQQTFWNKLQHLELHVEELLPALRFIPTGWKAFQAYCQTIQLPGRAHKLNSALMSVMAHVYLAKQQQGEFLSLTEWITTLQGAPVTHFMKLPYKGELRPQPTNLVMGKKYVIRRPGNNKVLTDLLRRGGFSLFFLPPDKTRWKDQVEGVVRPTDKMNTILKHPKVKITLVRVLPPQGPASKIRIQLVFQGPLTAFLATDHLTKRKKQNIPKRKHLAGDINRKGKYAFVSTLNLPLPPHIQQLCHTWKTLDKQIPHLARLKETVASEWKKQKYSYEIERLYARRERIRNEYHLRIAQWIGQQLMDCQAKVLILEDLTVETRGTKGALAKAIESMPDDIGLYAREVLAVRQVRNDRTKLVTLSPYGSSTTHVGCGGKIQRSQGQYDSAPCKKCSKQVNTHYNAALWLEAQYLCQHASNKNLTSRSPSILPLLGLSHPPTT